MFSDGVIRAREMRDESWFLLIRKILKLFHCVDQALQHVSRSLHVQALNWEQRLVTPLNLLNERSNVLNSKRLTVDRLIGSQDRDHCGVTFDLSGCP
jgi:hypothetical protein